MGKKGKFAHDFFVFIKIFSKKVPGFKKIYEKIVKSAIFVILTIAFFFRMAIMIIERWHSNFLSANDSPEALLNLKEELINSYARLPALFVNDFVTASAKA